MASEEKLLSNDVASEVTSKLYLNTMLANVTFIVESDGKTSKVPANKAILAALSPFFKKLLFGPRRHKGNIKIVGVTVGAFKEFLQFFYMPRLSLQMENFDDVIHLADKYGILHHVVACTSQLPSRLKLENTCWAFQLAIKMNNEPLRGYCEKVVSALPLDVFQSQTFLRCDGSVLKKILQLRLLACDEVDIFDACMAWAKRACDRNNIDARNARNLRDQLGDCFELIRFGAMKAEVFTARAIPYKDMFTHKELSDLLFSTTIKNFPSKPFDHKPRSRPFCMWNARAALVCIMDKTTHDVFRWVIDDKFTYFSVNYPVLLGRIDFHQLMEYSNNPNGAESKLTIKLIEFSDQSFEECVAKKLLYEKMAPCSVKARTHLMLLQPIVINPNKMYQISWEQTGDAKYFYYESENDEIIVDDPLRVKLHAKTPNAKRTGLVARLYFNRFQDVAFGDTAQYNEYHRISF